MGMYNHVYNYGVLIVLGNQILYPACTEWSFRSLFSRALTSSCPLASFSQVVIEANMLNGQPAIVTTPSASYTAQGIGARNDHIWMLYDVENATSM